MSTEPTTTAPAVPDEQDLLRRSDSGDWSADQALLEREKSRIRTRQQESAIAGVEDHVRGQIWAEHAASFGLDPSDAGVAKAIADAKDFRALNKALLALSDDDEVAETVLANPKVQQRLQARDAKAREERAAQAPSDPIAAYAAAWQRGEKPSRELTEAYQRATGRRR